MFDQIAKRCFCSNSNSTESSDHDSESFHSSSDDDDDDDDQGSNFQPSPTDESWGGGPFSLRHTLMAEARFVLKFD